MIPDEPSFTLEDLYQYFPDRSDRPECTAIEPERVPEPYHRLLVHPHHMTVTVEEFYGSPVDVKVLDARHEGESYARKILLTLRNTGRVVQFGIVHIDLTALSVEVREEIISRRTPLGRVLIQHNVLRTVHPIQYFRAVTSPIMSSWFGTPEATPTFGRLGVIVTNGMPAIRVAEIMVPVTPGKL